MANLFCKPGDVVCYGPRMTSSGFSMVDCSFQAPSLEKRVFPHRHGARNDRTHAQLRPGLYYVNNVNIDREEYSTIDTEPCFSEEAPAREIFDYLKEANIYDWSGRGNFVLRKCWDVTHSFFIYSYSSDKKAFKTAEECPDRKLASAFLGLDPNRDGFYPFNPKARLLVKTRRGAIQPIRTGKFTPHFLYNAFPIAEELKDETTVDDIIDALMDLPMPNNDFTLFDYMVILSKFNRDRPLRILPEAYWINRRLLFKADKSPVFVVTKQGKEITMAYLCNDSYWESLKKAFAEIGYPCTYDKDFNESVRYLLTNSVEQDDIIPSGTITDIMPEASFNLKSLTNNGILRISSNHLYLNLLRVERKYIMAARNSIREIMTWNFSHDTHTSIFDRHVFGLSE